MMRTPAPDLLMLAAEWLDSYDPEAAEYASMQHIATWLRAVAENESFKRACNEAGVPVCVAKRALRAASRTDAPR